MTLLLGIDFETTGLDPEKDKIIEVGCCVMDTDTWQPVWAKSGLIDHGSIELSKEITTLTGITTEMLARGCYPYEIDSFLPSNYMNIEYLVAHNAAFEQSFINNNEFLGCLDILDQELPWIDTKTDIPGHEGKKLTYLAADHGFVNPFPHRALFDVMTMFKVLSCYDFKEIERRVLADKVTLIANVPYDDREKAKALGFQWQSVVPGKWAKRVPDFEADTEIHKAERAYVLVHKAEKENNGHANTYH